MNYFMKYFGILTDTMFDCSTLFAQLDHCITAFGKRLLKAWIARPLYDRKSILERQDAIAGFKVFIFGKL